MTERLTVDEKIAANLNVAKMRSGLIGVAILGLTIAQNQFKLLN